MLLLMDVQSAYLHPKTGEKDTLSNWWVSGKLDSSGKKFVGRMNESVYGLKRAAKNWYEQVANFLTDQNCVRSENDYCLFKKFQNKFFSS